MKSFLGEGGKKRVYLGHDSKLDSDVAIAVIKTEGLDAEGVTRIRREGQAMGRLRDHPHVVTVLDIGDEGGQPYIVMEYMEGGSLDDLLQQAEHRRLPMEQALRIAEQVCQALEHAHSRGIIHRDLKPGNVWLTQDRTAKLGDFGLAVALDRSRLTQAGMIVGTANYMPPEQAVGGEVTPRSDLYSLGCVLYEMVAGRPPFLGDDTLAVISQHINTAPVAPTWHTPEVPRALEALIMRLLAKAPDERPESASAAAEELRRISEHPTEETLAPPLAATDVRGVDWGRFVGRQEELDQLKGALENALSGRGALVMLVGEPGIGKTRLAEEFGVYASLRGAQVLTGRCYEGEAALPYRPFVEAFREYVRGRADTELRGELGEGAPEVAKLVSEVRRRFPDIVEAPPLEADAERLRLFESVSAFVRNAAQANPLVLLLDDLHWADKPSLLMLRYLARGIADQRILIVGAYRDVELDRAHPLSEVIATLRQEQPYQRVLLRGLPEEEVLAFLAALEPSEESSAGRQALATALYQETEGNPFFIRAVISHLMEEGKLVREGGRGTTNVTSITELGIPGGVREVVGRRLSRLSDGCNRMLTLASTMTGGFSWEELKAITGESEAALLDPLEEALAAQVVQERKRDRAGSYDFTHALIRQTLYEELSTPRRVILHRQIGGALEELHADNLEPHLAELAHHFYEAAPGGDVDKAIDYATRAGDRAVELLAYEEAAGHYETALQALELSPLPDEAHRCDLLLTLGDAYSSASDGAKTKEVSKRAAESARRLGSAERLARAALAHGGGLGNTGAFEMGVFDATLVALLEEALRAVGEEDSSLRVKLIARVAVALFWSESQGRRDELSRQAIDMAHRLGDRDALAFALDARVWALAGPDNIEERLAAASQLIEVMEGAATSHGWFLGASLEVGDLSAVEQEFDFYSQRADELRQPLDLWYSTLLRAMRALMEGRFDEGESLALQAFTVAQRVGHPTGLQAYGAQMLMLRRDQGRLAELEGAVQGFVQQYGAMPAWRAGLALIHQELGNESEARNEFDRLAINNFADIPGDFLWFAAMAMLAEVCPSFSDTDRAATLYDLLLPYAKRNVTLPFGICYFGPVAHALGLLARSLGRWDDAARHFESAIEMNTRMGARPWLARSRYEYARTLLAKDEVSDRVRALDLVNPALETAQELGMAKLVEQALELKMRLQGLDPTNLRTSIDAVAATIISEQPDLRQHAAPDGTVTILFSDIESHTAINERLGDQRWMELLREHNALVREQIQSHDGYEVKTEGDGFMVAFGSARKAVQCAIAVQRAFAKRNDATDEPVLVRIGLHTGEPVQENNDFYGTQVTQAARIGNEANGGEILVSALLKELTEASGDIAFRDGREVELKDLGSQQVFGVAWEQS